MVGKTSYELYDQQGKERCAVTLPVNEITETLAFTRFATLSLSLDSFGPRPLIVRPWGWQGPGPNVNFGPFVQGDGVAHTSQGATVRWADVLPGVSPLDSAPPGDVDALAALLDAPISTVHRIKDVTAFLARRTVQIDGKDRAVELLPTLVAGLLRGDAVVAQAGDDTVLIAPEPGAAPHPRSGADRLLINDVPAFLSAPSIVGPGGERLSLALEAEDIRRIAAGEEVEVAHAGNRITLTPGGGAVGVARSAATATVTAAGLESEPQRVDASGERELVEPTQQPAAHQLALSLPFTQRWRLLGYSRSSLVQSIMLAPQEELTIEVFSWDRTRRSDETSTTAEVEQSEERVSTTKDSLEVMNQLTNTSEFKAGTDGKGGFNAGVWHIEGSHNLSLQNGATDAVKSTRSSIHESTSKAASRVRASRTVKVSETREYGSEQRVTRKLKNPNMCHTLALNFFEVIANYEVTTVFERRDAQLVALVENPLAEKIDLDDRTTLRIHERTLRTALLAPELGGGFAAVRLLYAYDRACAVLTQQAKCITHPSELRGSPEDPAKLEEAKAAFFALFNLLTLASTGVLVTDLVFLGTRETARLAESLWGTDSIKRWVLRFFLDRVWPSLRATAQRYKDVDWTGANAPLPAALADMAQLAGGAQDMLGKVLTGEASMQRSCESDVYKKLGGTFAWPDSKDMTDHIKAEILNGSYQPVDDGGLGTAFGAFKAAYDDWRASGKTQQEHSEEIRKTLEAIAQERESRLTELYSLQQLVEAQEQEDALIKHLQAHAEHYKFAIWSELALTSPAAFAPSLLFESGIVERRAVGLVEGKLAVPVRLDKDSRLQPWLKSLLASSDAYAKPDADTTTRISLPTSGMQVESFVGTCPACEEFIQRTRASEERLRAANADQADAEAKRRERLLKGGKLEPFEPTEDGAVRVVLEPPAASNP